MDDESEVCPFPLSDVGVPRSSWARSSHPSTRPSGFRSAAMSGLQRDPLRANYMCAQLGSELEPVGSGESILYTRDTYEIAGTGEQRQYVAPVTGGVPDRQQNRHVALLCRCECLGPQGYQSTGFSRCRRRYGEVSSANRFTRSTASPPLS